MSLTWYTKKLKQKVELNWKLYRHFKKQIKNK